MKFILLIALPLLLAACASTPSSNYVQLPPSSFDASPATRPSLVQPRLGRQPASKIDDSESNIDYVSLQRDLGLNRSLEDLGYAEKSFDTCSAGYGYSSTHDCHREYFIVLNFQLLCRDSVGTISTSLTSRDVQALSGRSVKWMLRDQVGTLQLNSEGYGQIKAISEVSQKAQRIRLTVGNDFLSMRVNEINRVVTPREWCN